MLNKAGSSIIRLWQPQILEVFKNTLPNRIYWVPFPIGDARLVVETAKMILTKEKIDRQLAGQSTLIPFIKVRDGYHNTKAITFNRQDRLDDKFDKLTSMMSKLTAQGNKQDKHFQPKKVSRKKERTDEELL